MLVFSCRVYGFIDLQHLSHNSGAEHDGCSPGVQGSMLGTAPLLEQVRREGLSVPESAGELLSTQADMWSHGGLALAQRQCLYFASKGAGLNDCGGGHGERGGDPSKAGAKCLAFCLYLGSGEERDREGVPWAEDFRGDFRHSMRPSALGCFSVSMLQKCGASVNLEGISHSEPQSRGGRVHPHIFSSSITLFCSQSRITSMPPPSAFPLSLIVYL